MDTGNTSDFTQPSGPGPVVPGLPQFTPPPAKKGTFWKVLWAIGTAFSVLANVMMFFILIAVVFTFTSGTAHERQFVEKVIEDGPRMSRIAVVSVDGIIEEQTAQEVYRQIKAARADKTVKGLIIRVNSPGGTISGSDQIYNEILKYRVEKKKPAIAFMRGIAASGGYYSSVACDTIVAEPTTITGSIGVILNYLVLQGLLEEKLGIQPVVVKAGEKKDWPSSFKPPTDEQLLYLQERIITPAYERFVKIVVDGRKMLTEEEIRQLADGSIYWADQAVEKKLIDKIGYLKDAIKEAKSQAGLEKAQVFEYQKSFSFADVLSAESKTSLKIDKKMLYELSVPQVLYLWTGQK
ncbi:MAG: signal peptide peptidase SppA [Sedimentisphaerales bacterium]|nr:signal peptide peptidase SppA [Sedimentisphaerales bacterium]